MVLKKKRLEDALYLTDLIRSICNSHKKSSMPYQEIVRLIAMNHKRFPKKEEIVARIDLLMVLCPEFCSVKKCVTMKVFCYHHRTTLYETQAILKREIAKVAEKC